MGTVFLGLRQFIGLRLIGAIKIFDFIILIIDLMERFYRDSFNNDRNVSDKLSQDSNLKSPKLFLSTEKDFSYGKVTFD